jgi:hypothetical protein
MSFVLGSSDVFPYVCGVYTCRCGRRSVRHGRGAAELPQGWVEHAGEDDETMPICPSCAARARAAAADGAG